MFGDIEDKQMSTESSANGSAMPDARTNMPGRPVNAGPAACISSGSGSTPM